MRSSSCESCEDVILDFAETFADTSIATSVSEPDEGDPLSRVASKMH